MLILLVGPKGSGKSHIGRALAARLGVHFFHVEPHWLAYNTRCAAAGREPVIPEGIAEVHPLVARALEAYRDVCVETTGASSEILQALLSLRPRGQLLVARVTAPIDLCLQRIAARDPAQQIPMAPEMVRRVHALSEALELEPDLELNNEDLTEEEIAAAFADTLRRRGPA